MEAIELGCTSLRAMSHTRVGTGYRSRREAWEGRRLGDLAANTQGCETGWPRLGSQDTGEDGQTQSKRAFAEWVPRGWGEVLKAEGGRGGGGHIALLLSTSDSMGACFGWAPCGLAFWSRHPGSTQKLQLLLQDISPLFCALIPKVQWSHLEERR